MYLVNVGVTWSMVSFLKTVWNMQEQTPQKQNALSCMIPMYTTGETCFLICGISHVTNLSSTSAGNPGKHTCMYVHIPIWHDPQSIHNTGWTFSSFLDLLWKFTVFDVFASQELGTYLVIGTPFGGTNLDQILLQRRV